MHFVFNYVFGNEFVGCISLPKTRCFKRNCNTITTILGPIFRDVNHMSRKRQKDKRNGNSVGGVEEGFLYLFLQTTSKLSVAIILNWYSWNVVTHLIYSTHLLFRNFLFPLLTSKSVAVFHKRGEKPFIEPLQISSHRTYISKMFFTGYFTSNKLYYQSCDFPWISTCLSLNVATRLIRS